MQTEREKDGWRGPVKSVAVEMAEFIEGTSGPKLGTVFPLVTFKYDLSGSRLGPVAFHSANISSLPHKFTTKWKDQKTIESQTCYSEEGVLYTVKPTYREGRIIQETFFDNKEIARYIRKHRYDLFGHPTEMIHLKADGTPARKLEYYNKYDREDNLIEVTIYEWLHNQPISRPLMIIYYTIAYF